MNELLVNDVAKKLLFDASIRRNRRPDALAVYAVSPPEQIQTALDAIESALSPANDDSAVGILSDANLLSRRLRDIADDLETGARVASDPLAVVDRCVESLRMLAMLRPIANWPVGGGAESAVITTALQYLRPHLELGSREAPDWATAMANILTGEQIDPAPSDEVPAPGVQTRACSASESGEHSASERSPGWCEWCSEQFGPGVDGETP